MQSQCGSISISTSNAVWQCKLSDHQRLLQPFWKKRKNLLQIFITAVFKKKFCALHLVQTLSMEVFYLDRPSFLIAAFLTKMCDFQLVVAVAKSQTPAVTLLIFSEGIPIGIEHLCFVLPCRLRLRTVVTHVTSHTATTTTVSLPRKVSSWSI